MSRALKPPKPGAMLALRTQAHRWVARRLGNSPWNIHGDRAAYFVLTIRRSSAQPPGSLLALRDAVRREQFHQRRSWYHECWMHVAYVKATRRRYGR